MFHHAFTTLLPSKNLVQAPAFSKTPLKNPSKNAKNAPDTHQAQFFLKSPAAKPAPSKVVWASGRLTGTLQPLRGRKTVQEIHRAA
jgi:hypothetical protein